MAIAQYFVIESPEDPIFEMFATWETWAYVAAAEASMGADDYTALLGEVWS
jgi:hypothetical protein